MTNIFFLSFSIFYFWLMDGLLMGGGGRMGTGGGGGEDGYGGGGEGVCGRLLLHIIFANKLSHKFGHTIKT